MIVPIAVTPPNAFSPKLPPCIATLGHDELVLIELQGTLDVQCPELTTKDGQLIGTLNVADMVRTHTRRFDVTSSLFFQE
jgi:chromosome transmission fidelity protein 8